MKTLKENKKYIAADMRQTYFTKPYQLLEITPEVPQGETIGVYATKKDVLDKFKELANKE